MSKQSEMKFWIPNDAVVNTNLRGLIGAKLTVTDFEGRTQQCVIAGVDPYIGLSLVLESDSTHIINCLHGPFDPNYREEYLTSEALQVVYNTKFPDRVRAWRKAVRTGFLDFRTDYQVNSGTGGGTGICPYGM